MVFKIIYQDEENAKWNVRIHVFHLNNSFKFYFFNLKSWWKQDHSFLIPEYFTEIPQMPVADTHCFLRKSQVVNSYNFFQLKIKCAWNRNEERTKTTYEYTPVISFECITRSVLLARLLSCLNILSIKIMNREFAPTITNSILGRASQNKAIPFQYTTSSSFVIYHCALNFWYRF